MNDPQFRRLPRLVGTCATVGWYQGTSSLPGSDVGACAGTANTWTGSVFFLITGENCSPNPRTSNEFIHNADNYC